MTKHMKATGQITDSNHRSELIKRLTRSMIKNQARKSKEKKKVTKDPMEDKKRAWNRAMKGL